MMRCNWCGKGDGRNYTRNRKNMRLYYYYCSDCVGNFRENPFKEKEGK